MRSGEPRATRAHREVVLMSKSCIGCHQGAQKIFNMTESKYLEAIDRLWPKQKSVFPIRLYLPIIYAMTGIKVAVIEDMKQVLDICRRLIPPPVRETYRFLISPRRFDAGNGNVLRKEMLEAIRISKSRTATRLKQRRSYGQDDLARGGNDVIFRNARRVCRRNGAWFRGHFGRRG